MKWRVHDYGGALFLDLYYRGRMARDSWEGTTDRAERALALRRLRESLKLFQGAPERGHAPRGHNPWG